jgi:hypothetical protein
MDISTNDVDNDTKKIVHVLWIEMMNKIDIHNGVVWCT